VDNCARAFLKLEKTHAPSLFEIQEEKKQSPHIYKGTKSKATKSKYGDYRGTMLKTVTTKKVFFYFII